jgi:hypothetical protein
MDSSGTLQRLTGVYGTSYAFWFRGMEELDLINMSTPSPIGAIGYGLSLFAFQPDERVA